jgi:hypothetical protein
MPVVHGVFPQFSQQSPLSFAPRQPTNEGESRPILKISYLLTPASSAAQRRQQRIKLGLIYYNLSLFGHTAII